MAEVRKRNISSKTKTEEASNDLPEIADVTDEQKKLPLEDKLKIIDDEIRLLRDFCLQSGYSKSEIESCASPLLDFLKDSNRRKWKRRALKLILIVSVLAFLYYYDPAYNLIRAHVRYAELKTLPYWDWTYLFEEDCIIENPYFEPLALDESDCEGCEGLIEIEKLDEIPSDEITTDFLYMHVPVVVTDAMTDWKALKEFDMNFLARLYIADPVLNSTQICGFLTSEPDAYLKTMLLKIKKGNLTHWHMIWQNCEDRPVKVIRSYYSRPYFLPPMVEMSQFNWIFADSGVKNNKDNKEVENDYQEALQIEASMSWFAQVRGQYEVILTPNEICQKMCSELTVILNPGEILAFTNLMWTFKYRVVGEEDAIAIAASGIWD